jgi:hypothetical protein
MNLGAAAEATILYRTPDGRTVFRPWGARGPCYLVEGAAGARLTRFIRVYYAAFFIAIIVLPFVVGVRGIYVAGAVWAAGFYLAFWVFSRGLPTTDPPPLPTRAEREEAIRRISGSVGKPVLWALTILSAFLSLSGVLVILATPGWTAWLPSLFFAACTAVFVYYLRRA